jgi:hypothetical protein
MKRRSSDRGVLLERAMASHKEDWAERRERIG